MRLDPHFSRREVLELSDRLEMLYRSRTFAQLMPASIELLRPFVASDYWCVGCCDPRLERVIAIGWPAEFPLFKYTQRVHDHAHESPLFQYWARTRDHDRVLRRSDCCDESKFRRSSALYNELFKPLRVTRQIGTWLRPGGGRHLEVGLHRGGRVEFDDHDVARMTLLRTHIFRAYLNVFDFERFERSSRPDTTHDADALPPGAFELQDTSLSSGIDRTTGEFARGADVHLTPREHEVLHWVAQGKTNQEIGIILGTSWRTVRKQLEHIFRKLNVETRTAAAIRATELGCA